VTVLYFYEGAFTLWRRRMTGICAEARRHGWSIHAVNADGLSTNAKGAVDFWKPGGVIVDGGVLGREGFGVQSYDGIPAVFCDADESAVGGSAYRLAHDSDDTARTAVAELVSLNSESLGFVSYHKPRDWSDARRRVVEKVAEEEGVPFFAFDSAAACEGADISVFLSRLANFLRSLPRPAGVLAANDEMAAHVLSAAEAAGISVPDDLAVMGIDDDELICENTHPTLSSVAPDFERSGRLAADLLARCIADRGKSPATMLYGASPLVRRRSTRVDAARDPRIVRALELIRRDSCSGATVKDVIAAMGMKPRSAEARFKEVCGHSIKDEIMAVRLARAKRLLSDTDLPISIVCERCGYTDERSLRYLFSKATGLSPADWRARAVR
jgi:LacI family transcriptional regulator